MFQSMVSPMPLNVPLKRLLTSVSALKRYEPSGPSYGAPDDAHSVVIKRLSGPCSKEGPDGKIINCGPEVKRDNCWETENGQIQCFGEDYSTATDSSSTDGSTVSSNPPALSPLTVDDSTDDTGSTATTCIHTAEGFLQCGDVMIKREILKRARMRGMLDLARFHCRTSAV